MTTSHKETLVTFVLAVSGAFFVGPAVELQAGQTVVNRTPYVVYVATGHYAPARQWQRHALADVEYLDAVVTTRGWYKLAPYGGSATVPDGNYLLVSSSAAKMPKTNLVRLVNGDQELPVDSSAFQYQDRVRYPKSVEPLMRAKVQNSSYRFERFIPSAHFRSGNQLEITVDRLGWLAPQESIVKIGFTEKGGVSVQLNSGEWRHIGMAPTIRRSDSKVYYYVVLDGKTHYRYAPNEQSSLGHAAEGELLE